MATIDRNSDDDINAKLTMFEKNMTYHTHIGSGIIVCIVGWLLWRLTVAMMSYGCSG